MYMEYFQTTFVLAIIKLVPYWLFLAVGGEKQIRNAKKQK